MKVKSPRVAVTTLGCKVNQFESASFISSLVERGAEIVPFSHEADIYIINSCAVTARAGAESRRMVRRAYRLNPEARIVVTGCYAQMAGGELLDLVDQPVCLVGNAYKHLLVDYTLADDYCDIEMYMTDISKVREICDLPVKKFRGRTRAFLKIQDGCNSFCSYCIIPYARGRSRSLPLDRVLEQARIFAEQGYREIVVTGIHVGKYGADLESSVTLAGLMEKLALHQPDIRFRISSLEPGELNDDLLALIGASPNIMPHLHIPLQSGDSGILKKMNRHYTPEDYIRTVEKITGLLPDAAIGSDVLVGFPGEDDQAFENTRKLLTGLPISYLHVFPYSKRPITLAARMKGHIPGPLKTERVEVLRRLDREKRSVFYNRFAGTVHKVLAENKKNRFHLMRGFTENYIPVYFPAPSGLSNRICDVRIDRVEENTVFGEIVP